MRLRTLQEELEALYGIHTDLDIRDFLLDEDGLAQLGASAQELSARGEVLFLIEQEGEVSVGLYLAEPLQRALEEDHSPPSARYHATLEGVSHFVYLSFHAQQDRPVRQIELELQAEVDKFAAGVLGLARPRRAPPKELRRRLYEESTLHPSLAPEEEERYATAAHLARRYALFLEQRYLARERTSAFLDELRTFYRLAFSEKVARALGS